MSRDTDAKNDGERDALLEMIQGSWKSQAICVAAKLNVADALARGATTAEAIAGEVGADVGAMARLLRALSTLGLVRAGAGGTFELTPMGARLRSDHPESLRAWSVWWGEHLWPVWGHLQFSVRTGKSARADLLGRGGFEHLEADAGTAALFHAALAELSRLSAPGLLRAGNFGRFTHVVDVGGGNGEFLAAILGANAGLRGTLLERPHALEAARGVVSRAGLGERCVLESGDFFERVPEDGDAYVLKSVLHDWNDADARRVLAACRLAMRPGAVLLVIEQAMPDEPCGSAEHQSLARSDLNMLAAHGACERTVGELCALMQSEGLRADRVIPGGMTFTMIEARVA